MEPSESWLAEVLSYWGELVRSDLGWFAGKALLAMLVTGLSAHFARTSPSWLRLGLVLLALAGGGYLALSQLSLVDDAFISLRYAANLAAGKGLVWNEGEYVEGYSNFLWTLLLAGAVRWIPLDPPAAALFGCAICYVAATLALARAGGRLEGPAWVPAAAAILYAVQNVATEFASTGLETSLSALLIALACGELLQKEGNFSAFRLSSLLVLASLNHPDHALFWLVGAVVAVRRGVRESRGVIGTAAAYAVPALPCLGWLAWKLGYYGAILPNTYYAKSGGSSYWSQGAVYTTTFVVGAHLWLIALVAVPSLRRLTTSADRPFLEFALPSLALYHVYVAKVGGDFMYGRFFLVVLPIWLLLAEAGLRALARTGSVRLVMLGSVCLGLTAVGLRIVGPEKRRWNITNEWEVYQVSSVFPSVVVKHENWVAGQRLRAYLTDRGIRVPIATSGIGMVGYYSGLEVIDLRGLTDSYVAHLPVRTRGMPGHEKWPDRDYLRRRGVVFVRWVGVHPKQWRTAAAVRLGTGSPKDWQLMGYDATILRRVEAVSPEVRFTPFEPVLDAWLREAPSLPPPRVAEDAAFFEEFYFRFVADPDREAAVRAAQAGAASAAPN